MERGEKGNIKYDFFEPREEAKNKLHLQRALRKLRPRPNAAYLLRKHFPLMGVPFSVREMQFSNVVEQFTPVYMAHMSRITTLSTVAVDQLGLKGGINIGVSRCAIQSPYNSEYVGGPGSAVALNIGVVSIDNNSEGFISSPAVHCDAIRFQPSPPHSPSVIARDIMDVAIVLDAISKKISFFDPNKFIPTFVNTLRKSQKEKIHFSKHVAFIDNFGLGTVDAEYNSPILDILKKLKSRGLKVHHHKLTELEKPLPYLFQKWMENPISEFDESFSQEVKNIVNPLFGKYNIVITPCTACLPPKIGQEDNDLNTLISRNMFYYAFQAAKCASLMMPICLSPTLKLPVAIQIVGPPQSDHFVLQFGNLVQKVFDPFKYPMIGEGKNKTE